MKQLPLYVALDVDHVKQALLIAEQTTGYVEGFKVGPRLFFRSGQKLISKLRSLGKVFLDFKFFDIPSSMVGAVQSAFDLGADQVSVHASAGMEALKQLSILEKKLKTKREFRILAVTVLTSFSQTSLPNFSKSYSLFSQVESLADLVVKSGLTGLVCSGQEVAHLRKRYPQVYLLVPGVRLLEETNHRDQKRVITPQKVLKLGANAFVMGRPIYGAQYPAQFCKKLVSLLR